MKNSKCSEEINVTILDIFCLENNIKQIDFLKMDVQGYEYNIFLGAKNLLENKAIGCIEFEFDEPSIENRIFLKDWWYLLSDDYDIIKVCIMV